MYSPKSILPLDTAHIWSSDSSSLPLDPMPLQRLRSPIHLSDSHMTPPPITCLSRPRKRSKANLQHPNRRRTSPRGNFRVKAPEHVFDQLPWISTLHTAPDLTNPWDIADLSLIPDLQSPEFLPSGLGPVRRRKSSLRSNPMDVSTSPDISIRDTSRSLPVPTPRSQFVPSRVLFHNLMPVPCD